MKVLSYKAVLPNNDGIVEGLDRLGYMTPQYQDLVYDYVKSIQLEGRCAFLYAGGAVVTASEARNSTKDNKYREPVKESTALIKELAAYSMHKWIGLLNGKECIEYVNINGNTCASSMHSLYEAEQLLNSGFDQVVIVAEEKTASNTLRIFDEHGIDLKVGEGCVVMHLGKASCPADEDITNCKWGFEYNRNPFGVTSSGYSKVFSECSIVKPHGTGTGNNEEAESIYKDKEQLRYKETYGHTQGVSGLLEVALVLDEEVTGDVCCISSGLGGFYGSCIVHK